MRYFYEKQAFPQPPTFQGFVKKDIHNFFVPLNFSPGSCVQEQLLVMKKSLFFSTLILAKVLSSIFFFKGRQKIK